MQQDGGDHMFYKHLDLIDSVVELHEIADREGLFKFKFQTISEQRVWYI